MIVATMAALVGVAAACSLKQRRKAAAACLLSVVVLAFVFGTAPVPRLLLRAQQADQHDAGRPVVWAADSLIIVLGMGTVYNKQGQLEIDPLSYGRIAQTLESYLDCKRTGARCRVLVTGGDRYDRGGTEATLYGDRLLAMGLQPADLLMETRSRNTWENAMFTRPIVDAERPQQVYLVTSGVHMGRALLYFRHFGLHPVPIRADYLSPWPSVLPMAYNITAAELALSEIQGQVRYRVYNALGKNPPALPAYVPPQAAND